MLLTNRKSWTRRVGHVGGSPELPSVKRVSVSYVDNRQDELESRAHSM
jgi:hypothetical protein